MNEVLEEIKKTNTLLVTLNKNIGKLTSVCEEWFKDDIRQHEERLAKLEGKDVAA